MEDSYVAYFNFAEATLWIVISIVLFVKRLKSEPAEAKLQLIAAIAFLLFGFSDLVETQTGAWWRPWWLFVWKACCVIVLVGTLVAHLRAKKSAQK
jgi:hypothetical protein